MTTKTEPLKIQHERFRFQPTEIGGRKVLLSKPPRASSGTRSLNRIWGVKGSATVIYVYGYAGRFRLVNKAGEIVETLASLQAAILAADTLAHGATLAQGA